MKIISKWGVGIDGIDVEAARARGIAVTNTPGVFGDDVADVAGGYLVMLARQLHRIHDSIASGGWFKHEGIVLSGKTLGVVGYGTIGVAVGRRGHGFGMKVLAFDPDPTAADRGAGENVEVVNRDDLFARSDFIVLCAPLLDSTRHMVNRETLSLMQPGSFLVNIARGGLVDEVALADALESGGIAAAALDVFENEPLAPDHPFRSFPQCVFGSHNGSNTREGVLRASELAAQNLFAGLGVA
jgi:D-3-phosphoglycerate dehydrogenase